MASLPNGALDLIAQLMQLMIELKKEIIALHRNGTPNTMQTSNSKKPDCPVIEPNATDNDWELFLDTWTRYKGMCRLTYPVETCNELRMTCSAEVNRLLFDLIRAEILNSATKGRLLSHIRLVTLHKEIHR